MPAEVALTGALPQRPPLSRVVIAATGDALSPAYYLMATALLSIVALIVIRRRPVYSAD